MRLSFAELAFATWAYVARNSFAPLLWREGILNPLHFVNFETEIRRNAGGRTRLAQTYPFKVNADVRWKAAGGPPDAPDMCLARTLLVSLWKNLHSLRNIGILTRRYDKCMPTYLRFKGRGRKRSRLRMHPSSRQRASSWPAAYLGAPALVLLRVRAL